MVDISISKLMIIALLALLVLGPEKLPKVAAQLGRWTGRARTMARNLRMQLEQEVNFEELKKQKEQAEAALKSANDAMQVAQATLATQHANLSTAAAAAVAAPVAAPAADNTPTNQDAHTSVATPAPAIEVKPAVIHPDSTP